MDLEAIGKLLRETRERMLGPRSRLPVAREVGTDHANLKRIEEGGNTNVSTLLEIAQVLDLEVRLVRRNAPESIVARVHALDDEPLPVLAEVLDLLLDAQPGERKWLLDYFRRDLPRLRAKLAEDRAAGLRG